jgi:hypothetical protein
MPSVVASDLIASSMRLIGATASGEVPNANEIADGLAVLNDMLESWSTESLTVYAPLEQSFPLTAGVATYTIGPTGAWSGPRPTDIDSAYLRFNGVDFAVRVTREQQEYDLISVKTVTGISQFALFVPSWPNAEFRLWPVPALAGMTFRFSSLLPFLQLANSAQAINYPPGYSKALRYCLALELAPEYGVPLRPEIVELANEAKAAAKRVNTRAPIMRMDDGTALSTTYNYSSFIAGF